MTKTPTVVIVEDDPWLAEQYIRMLRGAGFYVEHAPNGFAAMDIIEERQPAVIVLDLLLAGSNAFVLLHELRSHVDLAAIPIILCTNSATDIATDDITAYGVNQVLDKTTMHPDDLVIAVKREVL